MSNNSVYIYKKSKDEDGKVTFKRSRYQLMGYEFLKKRKNDNIRGGSPAVSCSRKKLKAQQKSWSLKEGWPVIYDQGSIGSCTANAFCSSFRYLCYDKLFDPSRLYVYYKTRSLEQEGELVDSGAWVVDAYNWVSSKGVCCEKLWPYDISKVNVSPPAECDQDSLKHIARGYYQVKIDDNLKNTIGWCLVQNRPVLMAFGVYKSFTQIGDDGICPLPNPKDYYENYDDTLDPFYGGHEVVIIGFDDEKRLYTVVNSWGSDWGNNGYFYMPYEFVDNPKLVYDFGVVIGTECNQH